MWSSWYLCGTPSNRILTDSSASTIQAYLVLFFSILRQVSRGKLLVFYKALLLALEFPAFYERFSWCFFKKNIIWFNEEDTTYLSGIFELWFLDVAHFCCFAFRCIRHMLPHVRPYIVGSWGCLFPRESLPGPVYPSGGLSFNKINLVKPVHASDNSLSPSTFQWSSIRFSNNTSSDVCAVLVTSIYFSFCSRHV